MRRLRDRDTADMVQRLTMAGWAAMAGVMLGLFVGVFLTTRLDWPFVPTILGAMLVVGGFVYTVARVATLGAGRAAGAIHSPSGHSTPYRFDYSQAAALEAQGDYVGAVVLYREAISADPEDPELHHRLARLLRDRLEQYDGAALSFRAARKLSPAGSRRELLLTRELIELALDRQHDPPRAAPELARLVERFPGSPEARWAREELAEIRKHID